MKKVISFLLILSLIGCLSACSTNKEKVTFEEIIEKSDRCVVVATAFYQPQKTMRKGNLYYTEVEALWGDTEGLPELITIVQEKSNYIKKDKLYAVFINESSEGENYFYVTEGKSGAICLDGAEVDCLDNSVQKNAEEIFGETYDEFEKWLYDEYVGEWPYGGRF